MSENRQPQILVIDDDDAFRDSVQVLCESVGHQVRGFASAGEFLETLDDDLYGCLVLDVRMPGMSGVELHNELLERGFGLPVIFITGHGDVPMAVDAMKAGALDFLQKPFRDQDLLDRINQALAEDQEWRAADEQREAVEQLIATLTPREKQVMERVARGDANKVIAFDLNVSQRTVEIHRARVMEKMGVRTLADLVRMASKAGL